MIVEIPVFPVSSKIRHLLKLVDVDKEKYNLLLITETKENHEWKFLDLQVLGFSKKLDFKRLGKAS